MKRWHPAILGGVLFLAALAAGHYLAELESKRIAGEERADLVAHGQLLGARISQEFGNVLYLSGGLSSYVATRHRTLDPNEIHEILSRLYADTRHVRNFGIAVDTTLTYIYPIEGNERAVGLNYRDLPAQWPGVKAAIDGNRPVLVGPITLVQGGRGLIYRVPISVDGRYWGLLSTVVDPDSVFEAVFAASKTEHFAVGLRSAFAAGQQGRAIFGDDGVFDRPGVELVYVEVPGGTWLLGVGAQAPHGGNSAVRQMRLLAWLLAAICGLSGYYFLRQRGRLEYLALYDGLTQLPNRRLIEDRAGRAVLGRRRDRGNSELIAAVLLLDLNGFKPVNDRHGHKAGDHVLRQTARHLTQALRETDTVGRWGGDEFVVVLHEISRQKLPEVVERIRAAVASPIRYESETLQVGAAIGVATIPDDGETVGDLIRLADQRMYEGKTSCRR